MDTVTTLATFNGPVYGVTAAARRVGCSPSYVHRLVKAGRVKPSVPSADGRRLFSERDVVALAGELRRERAGGPEGA